ncbi:MAG: sulfotransferase domain-containing protein [Cyanobacteria bacterium P01_A01_bin.114]
MNNFCLIIGTQKGGTTSLFSYLSQHPQVAASSIKETNFFSKEREWEKGISYYEGLWHWDPENHQIALEASPDYTRSLQVSETVIQRLKTVGSKFKFIYILRDPLEKIESMRKQGVYQGWYSTFLEKETPSTIPMDVIERVKYAAIIDTFVEHFSAESVLLMKTEDLKLRDQSAIAMANVCEFLDIDPSFRFALDKIHNAQNSYREDTLWHILRTSKYFGPLKNLFPDTIKNRVRGLLSSSLTLSSSLAQRNPADTAKNNPATKVVAPLTDAQKKFILNALSDELIRLETDYGLDISNWASRRLLTAANLPV